MDMQMPKPGPEHKKLAQLAGEWKGEETLFPSPYCPEEQKRSGHSSARVLENFFVVSDYEQKDGDKVVFRGHGVFSWDPKAEEYVMYWFDSMGGAGGVARGFLEGDVLTFRNTSPMGHHRYRYTLSKNEQKFEMAVSQDGQKWQEMMLGRYRRAH